VRDDYLFWNGGVSSDLATQGPGGYVLGIPVSVFGPSEVTFFLPT